MCESLFEGGIGLVADPGYEIRFLYRYRITM